MPAEFHRRGDVSIVTLVAESGYKYIDGLLAAEQIKQHLTAHPRLVDDWAAYSRDKRSSNGWYFEDGDSPSIGYYDATAGRSHKQMFPDRLEACAEFIRHELEAIRNASV